MGLQCFLFSSDEKVVETIRQVLGELDVQAESCPDAVIAAEKIAKEPFRIVIIDWDQQPEASLLLATARERKAAERPITLAIVSDDSSVPKALQGGANSILRRPIVVNQIKDTLKTARDLLRAKRDPATPASLSVANAAAAAAPALSPLPSMMEPGKEKTLRAGEFLQSAPVAPGGSFVTDSDVTASQDHALAEVIDPLKDLEPVAASVAGSQAVSPPPPAPGETRGLEWYLKARGVTRQAAPPPPPTAPESGKPELLGYDQNPSTNASVAPDVPKTQAPTASFSEEKKEAELFAYIDGENASDEATPRRFRLGKGPIIGAFVLASCAIAAAPQAPWHPKVQALWARGQHALHAWLNPQPHVAVTQAPAAHEDFARAGDEYKLPVAEAIPDATTDPSQIRVLPVIDPTAKKPNPDAAGTDTTLPQTDPAVAPPGDQPVPGVQVVETQPAVATPATSQPGAVSATAPAPVTVVTSAPPPDVHSDTTPRVTPIVSSPAPQRTQQLPSQSPTPQGRIPLSLRSQMASSVPDASGNKPVDAAMPSIEPVAVAESVERALLSDQPAISYPAAAKGQQGTVVLEVLVGRDGTVQDAKFLQGSLAFARAAIDGVKQWKFKPYAMNGHPVSVQTLMTISFKPVS